MKRAVVNIAFYLLLGLLGGSALGQTGRSSATPIPTPLAEVEMTALGEVYPAQRNKILEDSGRHFREGLTALKTSQRSDSGSKFDKSVESFLHSTLNIQNDQKLQTCYSQLIETIYRIEFPSAGQLPQFRALALACGWRWNDEDYKLADTAIAMLKPLTKINDPRKSGTATYGFDSQEFEPSPLDDLSRLELTTEEANLSTGRNGKAGTEANVIRAQAGDTVSRLATRHKADPLEVAKYNGLLPNSVLAAGREIRLPGARRSNPSYIPYSRPSNSTPSVDLPIGPRPAQSKNGSIKVILSFFNEVLHDPYSMRIVRWSPIGRSHCSTGPCWRAVVKYRAKNLMGAYVLSERVFYIRNNKIISTLELN